MSPQLPWPKLNFPYHPNVYTWKEASLFLFGWLVGFVCLFFVLILSTKIVSVIFSFGQNSILWIYLMWKKKKKCRKNLKISLIHFMFLLVFFQVAWLFFSENILSAFIWLHLQITYCICPNMHFPHYQLHQSQKLSVVPVNGNTPFKIKYFNHHWMLSTNFSA